MDGILNVYKEPGFTSFDVVARLRGILRQKKIGHTGTLDPQAVGVLPVCLGKATKVCELLTDHQKCYQADMLLGVTTDTLDMTGQVLTRKEPCLDERRVRQVMDSFLGKQMQIPPMYSALKVNGKKLCDLARQGIEVERKPRPIEIFALQIEEMELPRVRFSVTCSKGTYIRSLCQDIGERLGCGAALEHLTRTRVAAFSVEESLTLSAIEKLRDAGNLDQAVLPVDSVFLHLPRLDLTAEAEKLIRNGNPIPGSLGTLRTEETRQGQLLLSNEIARQQLQQGQVRVYDAAGEFLAVYACKDSRGLYQPVKMFL